MAVGARKAVVLMSLVQSLLFSGIIFGWPSFSTLLQQDGAFLDERRHAECRKLASPLRRRRLLSCGRLRRLRRLPWPPHQRPPVATLPSSCTHRCNATGFDVLDTACLLEQQTSLAMLYTVASTVFVFSLLLGGVMLDRCGAACTSTVAGVAFSSGFAMVACGDDQLLALAFALGHPDPGPNP